MKLKMAHIEYQKAITVALSNAIVKVADKELARLSGLDETEEAKAIGDALEVLGGLQSGQMPNYENEWVALFYITWYQPGQINLAYSMINSMAKRRGSENVFLTDAGKLHVVDFGCGALAMQFAVAFAAADALQRGESATSIRICSMDTSQSMVNIGSKVWEQFKIEVSGSAELAILNEACEVLEPTITVDFSHTAPNPREDSWLSAFHTVYSTNVKDVKDRLATIANRTKPDVGFITTHSSSKGHELIRTVSPFENGNLSDVVPESEGELEGTTQWRRNLRTTLHHPFLENPVEWKWNKAASLIYTKQ